MNSSQYYHRNRKSNSIEKNLKKTTLKMVSFAKIPDLVGYLVLTEYGAVLESDGDLKNDENCANIVTSIINLADRYR